jgi:hypothetical protein
VEGASSATVQKAHRRRAFSRKRIARLAAVLEKEPVSGKAQLAAATNLQDAETALRSFGVNYGVSIDVVAPAPPSSFTTAFDTLAASDLDALKAYGAVFIDEWAKYPLAFIAWSGLRTIKLVKNLRVIGIVRTASPTPDDLAMIYDITARAGDYTRTVIHHEFDHFFTFKQFGVYGPSDPNWVAANPPGFQYGNGGTACYVTPSACPNGPHVVDGFVSGYATSAIEEDKAETFGYLMDDAEYHQVVGWVKTDPALAAKVAMYEKYLCDISSAMCGSHFDNIHP